MSEVTDCDYTAEELGELRKYVETVASALTLINLSLTAARLEAGLLIFAKPNGLTARELATYLKLSPAAICHASRELEHAGFITRDRTPGERAERLRLADAGPYMQATIAGSALLTNALRGGFGLIENNPVARQYISQSIDLIACVTCGQVEAYQDWVKHRSNLFEEGQVAEFTKLPEHIDEVTVDWRKTGRE